MPDGCAAATPEIPGREFADALCEAVSTMAGIDLGIEEETFEPESRFDGSGVTGAMVLEGEKKAVLLISADRDSAAILVSSMTGSEPGEITDDERNDGIVEIVNMVAGTARTKLKGSDYSFRLSSPFAIEGEGVSIITKRNVPAYLVKINSGNMRFLLKIFYI